MLLEKKSILFLSSHNDCSAYSVEHSWTNMGSVSRSNKWHVRTARIAIKSLGTSYRHHFVVYKHYAQLYVQRFCLFIMKIETSRVYFIYFSWFWILNQGFKFYGFKLYIWARKYYTRDARVTRLRVAAHKPRAAAMKRRHRTVGCIFRTFCMNSSDTVDVSGR